MRALRLLPTWKACPLCGGGISPLKKDKTRGWRQRCRRKACSRVIYPHTRHPVFSVANGQDKVPLNTQAQVLFCRVAKIPSGKVNLLTDANRKVIENITKRWLRFLRRYVLAQERNIRLGDGVKWTECEVDEVTVKGARVDNGKRVTWYQYCGLLIRGDRRSLILEKMKVKTTSVKRHGKGKGSPASPGPISKVE